MKSTSAGNSNNASSPGRFWAGMLTGVFATIFLATVVGFFVIRASGLSISIDQETLARQVQERVQAEVAKELPNLLTKVKSDVPKAIAENLTDFNQVSIQIGSGNFPLPVEATNVFKEEFQGMAEEAIVKTIDGFVLDPYVEQIGQASYGFVKNTLQKEFVGKTFSFQANPWLSIPITVQGKQEK